MNITGGLFDVSDVVTQSATELAAQNLNTLYVVIASIILQVIMLAGKVYKKIQIKRKLIPTNAKLLKELKKIRTPSARSSMLDVKKAQKTMRKAKKRAMKRLSIYQEAKNDDISDNESEQNEENN